jgi:hypothetical protein
MMLLLSFGSLAITAGSLVYFQTDEVAPFILEKLPLRFEDLYLLTLQVHVVAAALALPGCLFLSSEVLLRRAPGVHRWVGRATALAVLGALVPSGAGLSLAAKGGLWGTAGFLLSGAITAVAMVQAVRHARARRIAAHRRAAWHVLAQLAVAVTSRALLVGFDALGVEETAGYLVALWVPVLAQAVAVELWLHPSSSRLPLTWSAHVSPALAVRPAAAGLAAGPGR